MSNYLIGTDPTLRKTKTPTVTALAAGVGFTAGTSTAITLGADPGSEEHVIVTMDGVTQHRSTYSVSGTTLTFDAAIPTGTAEIEATFGVPVSSVTVADDAVTLAKLASGTDGNIISYDASGNPVAISTGSDGQVLTSAGAGAQPAFEAAPGGHYTRISSTDISSAASYLFTAVDASSYDGYAFHIINLVPVTDDVKLYGQTSTDGGSTYDSGSSDYKWCVNERDSAQFTTGGEPQISFMEHHADAGYSVGSAAGETGVCGWIYVHSPQTTAVFTMITAILGYVGDDGMGKGTSLVTGIRASAADVDAWKFYYSSGNIESGTITAYGINNA